MNYCPIWQMKTMEAKKSQTAWLKLHMEQVETQVLPNFRELIYKLHHISLGIND